MNGELIPIGDWDAAITPVRHEVPRRYLTKAKRALDAGLSDAAITYVWDLVVNDLRGKVEAHGIDIFLSVEDGLKYRAGDSLADRWRDISDYRLLSGCKRLGLISRTGFRHLSFALSVRNHESAAHPVDEEEDLDRTTVVMVVTDAVRFVLSQDKPARGFNLQALAENLKAQDLTDDLDDVKAQIEHLTQEQCDSAVGMLTALFVGGSPHAKGNVLALMPTLWSRASKQSRARIGEKYARFATDGDTEAKAEIFSLLTVVDGVQEIPSSLRRALFRKASQALTDAHFDWENFAGEVAPARQLVPVTRR